MRAAALLLPIVALAAVAVASAPPGYGPDGDFNTAMTMDTNVSDMSADMNAVDYNMAESAVAPAWVADGEWLYGGSDDSGATWYIDLRASDLEARPIRVRVRAEESAMAGSRYGFTERDLAIDCAKYRYRVERTRHYDRDGRAAGPEQPGGGPLVRAAPGSFYAGVAQEACFHGMITDAMIANLTTTVTNAM